MVSMVLICIGLDKRSCSMPDPVSAWLGDLLGRVNHLGTEPGIQVDSA